MANQTVIGRTSGVAATAERKTHSPHAQLPRHAHADAKILCVLGGGFSETLSRHHFECSRGMVLMRGPEVPHANAYGPRGADCLVLTVPAERVASDPTLASLFAQPSVHRPKLSNIVTRINLELSRGDRAAALAIEGLTLELLADAVRCREERPGRVAPKCVRDAHEVFEAEYARTIRVADVAAAVGIHPVYLARAFREHFGYSPSQLVRLRRLENAARALSETALTLSEIAFDNGFASQSHFATSFLKYAGQTPSSYRSAMRDKRRPA